MHAGHGCSPCRDSSRQARVKWYSTGTIKVDGSVYDDRTLVGMCHCKHLIEPSHSDCLFVCVLAYTCILIVHSYAAAVSFRPRRRPSHASSGCMWVTLSLARVLCERLQVGTRRDTTPNQTRQTTTQLDQRANPPAPFAVRRPSQSTFTFDQRAEAAGGPIFASVFAQAPHQQRARRLGRVGMSAPLSS